MTWSELLHRLVLVQGSTRLCAVRDLDELDIVGRIMRKENYLIGMLNAGVLGLYVKGLGPLGGRRFMLTKTLEWNLYLCILDPMFDERFQIKQVRVLEEGLHACALGFARVCVLALGSPQMQSLQVVYMHSVSGCSGVSAKGWLLQARHLGGLSGWSLPAVSCLRSEVRAASELCRSPRSLTTSVQQLCVPSVLTAGLPVE